MNTTTLRIQTLFLMALIFAAAGSLPASAATKKKRVSVVQRHEGDPKYDRTPSGEGVSRREQRMFRECKGRPNAGACAGYAN